MAGPQEVLAKKGHSYRIKLLESIKIHLVFFAKYLRQNPKNPLLSQKNASLPPIQVTADKEYKVQEIIAIKLIRGKLVYKAKQTSVDKDPEFYPTSDFKYSLHLIRDFYLANPTLPGPPVNLALWLKAQEQGIDDYNHLDSDKLALACLRTSFFKREG